MQRPGLVVWPTEIWNPRLRWLVHQIHLTAAGWSGFGSAENTCIDMRLHPIGHLRTSLDWSGSMHKTSGPAEKTSLAKV